MLFCYSIQSKHTQTGTHTQVFFIVVCVCICVCECMCRGQGIEGSANVVSAGPSVFWGSFNNRTQEGAIQ